MYILWFQLLNAEDEAEASEGLGFYFRSSLCFRFKDILVNFILSFLHMGLNFMVLNLCPFHENKKTVLSVAMPVLFWLNNLRSLFTWFEKCLGIIAKNNPSLWRILKEKINFSESSSSVISRSVLRMSVYSPHRGTFDCLIRISNWYFSSQKTFLLNTEDLCSSFFQKEHLKNGFGNVSYYQTQTLEHFNFSKLWY